MFAANHGATLASGGRLRHWRPNGVPPTPMPPAAARSQVSLCPAPGAYRRRNRHGSRRAWACDPTHPRRTRSSTPFRRGVSARWRLPGPRSGAPARRPSAALPAQNRSGTVRGRAGRERQRRWSTAARSWKSARGEPKPRAPADGEALSSAPRQVGRHHGCAPGGSRGPRPARVGPSDGRLSNTGSPTAGPALVHQTDSGDQLSVDSALSKSAKFRTPFGSPRAHLDESTRGLDYSSPAARMSRPPPLTRRSPCARFDRSSPIPT